MRVYPIVLAALAAIPVLNAQNDWPAYGGDAANRHYSTLKQIDAGNVTKLTQAWNFDPRSRER